MKAFWHGASSGSPNNTAVTYNFLTADMQCGWPGFEYGNTTNAGRSTPLTDTVEITEVRVWITNAPGTGKSWTFAVRDDAVTTAASVTIANAAVSGGWTGSVTIAAGSLANLISTPSGTPAGTGQMHWVVTYQTAGNFYLALGGGQTANTGSVTYPQMSGCADAGAQTSSTEWAQLAPTGFSVTKLGIANLAQVGGSGSNTVVVRKNNTTDSTGVTMTAGNQSAIGSITSFAVAAGDTIIMKLTPAGGAAWGNFSTCATIVPDTAGEIAVFFGGGAGPSTSTTTYEGPQGLGNGAWNATENLVAYRFIPCTLKKFYVLLSAAPGSGKSWAVTVREQASDTALTTSIATAATSGNDTAHTELVAIMGSLIAVKAVPSGTPAGTQMRFSFVAVLESDAVGVLFATAQPVAASMSGSLTVSGVMAATMRAPTTAITGSAIASGQLAATMRAAVIALTGSEQANGTLVAAMRTAVASMTGSHAYVGTLSAVLRAMTASLDGDTTTGELNASLRALSASLNGNLTVNGVMAAVMRAALFNASGSMTQNANITATMRPLRIALVGSTVPPWGPPPAQPRVRFAFARPLPTPSIVSPTQIVTIRTASGVQLYQYLGDEQTSLTWSRERSETSRCELAIQSHIADSGRIPDITPWVHWADVWDDTGQMLLWSGPIIKFTANRDQMTISARDMSGLASRTRVPITKRWDAVDPAEVADELYRSMIEHHGLDAQPIARRDPLGDRFDFSVKADNGELDKVMEDLTGLGLKWTIVNGTPLLGPRDRKAVAALGEHDFLGDGGGLTITRDGTNSYNDVLLRSGDSLAHAIVPMGGLALQQTVDIDSMFGVSNTDRATEAYAAYVGKIRDMVSLADGAVLNPAAPISIEELIPTTRLTLEAYGMLFPMELTRVEVTTSAGSSQVSIALEGVDDELPELVELQARRYSGGQATS